MTDADETELTRRLRDHYRATAVEPPPALLQDEVHEMLSSSTRRRPSRGPVLALAAAAAVVAVFGSTLVLGERGVPGITVGATAPGPMATAPATGAAASDRPSPSAATELGFVEVLRGGAIGSAVLSASDETPFLIGGELSFMLADCFVPTDFPDTPLLRVCDDGLQMQGVGPLVGDLDRAGLAGLQGAVVLRVHARDPLAADCPDAYRIRCERAIVVEQELWRRPADARAPIPARLSLLPVQLPVRECVEQDFDIGRCIAIVEQALRRERLRWPTIATVAFAPPDRSAISGGSVGLITVVFGLADGTTQRSEVRCLGLRSASLVCGPGTIPTR